MKAYKSVELLSSYSLTALQVITYKKLQSRINGVLKQYGLNMTQWIILGKLGEKDTGLRATDLAKFMQVEVPLVTMVSQPLLGRGLIDSSVQKHDKRTKLLKLTASAQELIGTIDQKLQKQLAGLIKDISTQELQAYMKVLRSMMANAN